MTTSEFALCVCGHVPAAHFYDAESRKGGCQACVSCAGFHLSESLDVDPDTSIEKALTPVVPEVPAACEHVPPHAVWHGIVRDRALCKLPGDELGKACDIMVDLMEDIVKQEGEVQQKFFMMSVALTNELDRRRLGMGT